MTILQKFYADMKKQADECITMNVQEHLISFFVKTICSYDKQLEQIAISAGAYYISAYPDSSKEESIEWFYRLFALLTDNFSDDMDFLAIDWKELAQIISLHSDEVNIETVQSLMQIFVERHRI